MECSKNLYFKIFKWILNWDVNSYPNKFPMIYLSIINYLILGCRCSLNEETTGRFDPRQREIKWSASAVYLGEWSQGNENDSEECSAVPQQK